MGNGVGIEIWGGVTVWGRVTVGGTDWGLIGVLIWEGLGIC